MSHQSVLQKESPVQPKLEVAKEGNEQELEANVVVDKVMRMTDGGDDQLKMTDGPEKPKMLESNSGKVQKISEPKPVQKMEDLQVHKVLQPKIQREDDPKQKRRKELKNQNSEGNRYVPNEQVEGTQGSLDYMPDQADLSKEITDKYQTVDARKKFITDFIDTFYTNYVALKNSGTWDKAAMIPVNASNPDFIKDFQGIVISSTSRVTNWSDFGKRLSAGTDGYDGLTLIELKRNAKELEQKAADLKSKATQNSALKNESDAAQEKSGKVQKQFDAALEQVALLPENTTSIITSLRVISNIINRLYAAYMASQQSGVPFVQVLTIYGQEGNFEMPSSAATLANNIPTGETKGVTSLGKTVTYPDEKYEGKDVGDIKVRWNMDFKTGNLVVAKNNSKYIALSPEKRQLYALAQYFNQIGGLDVVNKKVDAGLNSLAAWSFQNRERLQKHGMLPAAQKGFTMKKMLDLWTGLRNGIVEEEKNREYKPNAKSGLKKEDADKVAVFAPSDPVFMTQSILTETALFYKNYDIISDQLFGKEEGFGFTPEMRYMLFNTSAVLERNGSVNTSQVELITVSALRAAKGLSVALAAQARQSLGLPDNALVTLENLKSLKSVYDEKTLELFVELQSLPELSVDIKKEEGQAADKWEDANNKMLMGEYSAKIQPWLKDKKQAVKSNRWALTQYFIAHSNEADWGAWLQPRRNASNFRTLHGFYNKTFNE